MIGYKILLKISSYGDNVLNKNLFLIMSYSSVYYFMIGDYLKHKEIGTYVDTNIENNDYKIIISKVDDIFYKTSETNKEQKK